MPCATQRPACASSALSLATPCGRLGALGFVAAIVATACWASHPGLAEVDSGPDADTARDDADSGPDRGDARDDGFSEVDGGADADGDGGSPDGDGGSPDGDSGDVRPDGSCPLPGLPVPLRPISGETTGAFGDPDGTRNPLRPTFAWSLSRGGCDMPTYDIQLDDSCTPGAIASCTFPSPEVSEIVIVGTSWTPAWDLPVASAPPVGRRYYWRVRACCPGDCCTAWSPAHYVEVGRARNDVNGDGYSDVLAGAPSRELTADAPGRALLFLGGPAMDDVAEFSVAGAGTDRLGLAVAFVGDLDADGYCDFAVGASGDPSRARVEVYRGRPSGDPERLFTLFAPTPGARFGFALDGAGDVDSDGYADLVIGAPREEGDRGGSAYLVRGGAPPDGVLLPLGEDLGGAPTYGWAVAGVGDVDADTFADVVVTHPNDIEDPEGAAVVYRGSAHPEELDSVRVSTSFVSPGLYSPPFGLSVSAAGDVNGDAIPDMLFGAPIGGAFRTSYAEVISLGTSVFPDGSSFILENPEPGSAFGFSVANAGDLNADGADDLAVSAIYIGGGRIYVYPGSVRPFSVPPFELSADESIQLGWSMAGAGDVDGDGHDDLVVGAPSLDLDDGNAGEAWLCFGGTGATMLDRRMILRGTDADGHLGFSVD
jgi:hypothetical protein